MLRQNKKEFIQENDFDSKKGQNLYLRDLAYKGAEKRYGNLDKLLKERLDFELDVIQKTGYPGYFLIVQDFINAAKEMGVSVGPGRGSAAGSVVAFSLGITNIMTLLNNKSNNSHLMSIDIGFLRRFGWAYL